MNDDDISELLRRARPGTSHRDMPITQRALDELTRLESTPSVATRAHDKRRAWMRGWRGITLGSVVIVATLAVLFTVVWNVQAPGAFALTPKPLTLHSIDGTAKGRLMGASREVLAATETSQSIRFQQWALNTTVGDDGKITSSRSEPEQHTLMFDSDGGLSLTIKAARPFSDEKPAGLPKPGTVLDREILTSGQYQSPYPNPVPSDPKEIGTYLAEAAGIENPTAGDYFRTIADLLSNEPISPAQESAILAFLASEDGVKLGGSVTDRLGRQGVVFIADDRNPGENRDLLIVSPSTGQIIAAETLYIGKNRTDISAPTVISYIAWDR